MTHHEVTLLHVTIQGLIPFKAQIVEILKHNVGQVDFFWIHQTHSKHKNTFQLVDRIP